jgi:hypothetical protein
MQNQSPIRVTDNKRKKFSNFSDAHPENSPNLRENLQQLTKNFSSGFLDPTPFASRSAAAALIVKNTNYLKTVNVSPNRQQLEQFLSNQTSPMLYS